MPLAAFIRAVPSTVAPFAYHNSFPMLFILETLLAASPKSDVRLRKCVYISRAQIAGKLSRNSGIFVAYAAQKMGDIGEYKGNLNKCYVKFAEGMIACTQLEQKN